MNNIKIELPVDVKFILGTLHKNGYEAYVVGGCVRDSILNRPVNDWDITTNALPGEVIKLFNKTILTGIKHGTVTIMINNTGYEVTTYRTEEKYSDGRHPDKVEFVTNLEEDLARRDFTINAMAYNDEVGLVDHYNGLQDTKNKLIRCVGNPEDRFKEDYLRILRAIRFSVQLGFKIEINTLKSLLKYFGFVNKSISIERRRKEFNKIIMGINRLYFNESYINILLDSFGFEELKNVFQNNLYHVYDVASHTLVSVTCVDTLELKLTMLLHDIGKKQCKSTDENGIDHFYGHAKVSKEIAEKWFTKYKYDNKVKSTVLTLIENHDITFTPTKKFVKRMINKLGEDNFRKLIEVRKADILAQNPKYTLQRLKKVFKVEEILEEVLEQQECFQRKDLVVNGNDLKELGLKGKEIGMTLDIILKMIINEIITNDKYTIMSWINYKIINNYENVGYTKIDRIKFWNEYLNDRILNEV